MDLSSITSLDLVKWGIVAFLLGIEALVLWYIATGRIDLSKLVSEQNGQASLSRFQFLLFTFVIVAVFVMIALNADPPNYPQAIPGELLGLMGISGGTYVASKGIQKNAEGRAKPEASKSGGEFAR